MKKVILLVAICLGMFACAYNNATENKSTETKSQNDRIEVLYFHGKQRCATCMAIEQNTKEVITEQFTDELKNGSIVFKSIDISKTENEKIAEKYEVTWSSLFICKWKNGKETYENLTEYAFASARTAPDTFKNIIIEKIKASL